jgi:hypothetical protein
MLQTIGKTLRRALPALFLALVVPLYANAQDVAGFDVVKGFANRVSGVISTQNLVPTGSATALSAVELELNGASALAVAVSGTSTGALSAQRTQDGITWETMTGSVFTDKAGTATATITSGTTGTFTVNVGPFYKARITGLAAMTGGARVVLSAGASPGGGSGSASGGLTDAELRATPVPVSGTVTANIGTVGTLSTAANQTTEIASIGATNETAAASNSATSGLNGLIRRFLGFFTATANADANRLPVSLEIASPVTGSAAAAGVLTNMPFFGGRGAASFTVNVTANTATANFESSQDNVTFTAVPCWVSNSSGSSGMVASATTTGQWQCPANHPYFQVRQSGAGGVTATVTPTARVVLGVVSANVGGGSITASGAAAVASTASGNPLPIAVEGRNAPPTFVTNGQVQRMWGTLSGKPVFQPLSNPENSWQYASAADVTDTTSTEMKAATASVRNYTSSCTFSNTDATVGTYVNILSASTVLSVVYVAPQVASTAGQNSLAVTFSPPLRGAVNEAINFQAVTTSAQLRVACQGFSE